MKTIKIIIFILFLLVTYSLSACDDTLIMMLTAKNPEGEFSKAIRNFSTDLTNLGLALDENKKDVIPERLKKVMSSWLEFSKAYSVKPPKEAANDSRWREKVKSTGQEIGKIRKLISHNNIPKAHDTVLDLSSKMGMFFESFGISDEKQMFVEAASNIARLQMYSNEENLEQMRNTIEKLSSNLEKFKHYLPKEGEDSALRAFNIIASMSIQINSNNINHILMDKLIDESETTFKELRSHILMKEWFSNGNNSDKGLKDD